MKATAKQKREDQGMPEPAAGQVWRDMDKRSNRREVEIVSVADGFCHCAILPERRATRISCDRMVRGSTGYEFVRTVKPCRGRDAGQGQGLRKGRGGRDGEQG